VLAGRAESEIIDSILKEIGDLQRRFYYWPDVKDFYGAGIKIIAISARAAYSGVLEKREAAAPQLIYLPLSKKQYK